MSLVIYAGAHINYSETCIYKDHPRANKMWSLYTGGLFIQVQSPWGPVKKVLT